MVKFMIKVACKQSNHYMLQ